MNLLKGTAWGCLFVLVLTLTPYFMILISHNWDSSWATLVSVLLMIAGSLFGAWIVIAKVVKYLEEEKRQ